MSAHDLDGPPRVVAATDPTRARRARRQVTTPRPWPPAEAGPAPVIAEPDPIRAALLALVPVPGWADASALDLIATVAAKLAGHADCHRLLHPAPGALGLDDARERCRAVLSTLAPAERAAVLGLLTYDIGGRP